MAIFCKALNKKALVLQMTMELGFTNEEIHKKTIPELKELLQKKVVEGRKRVCESIRKRGSKREHSSPKRNF
jgi:UDP-N-acetylmuramyl pentapeptide synthase